MKYQLRRLLLLLGIAAGSAASYSTTMDLQVELKNRGEPINPFIYGQFIEHLGRCIYGGIWAEMLEDRKFFFPVTEEYDPYKKLQDTDFPVVGASPWEIMGDVSGLTMVETDSFVGNHTPLILSGTGIRQRDLGVEKGKSYTGYIWLKNKSSGRTEVEVRFSDDLDGSNYQSRTFKFSGSGYRKFNYEFKSPSASTSATISVAVKKGEAFVGTLSLMPEDNVNGMRADTLALLKELNSPIYRWPGGNFVSGYNWRDGIGDRDRRPPRKNPAWTGVEHNDFGTDEYLEFCRLIGTEPAIAVNTGFGDDYTAAQWVEYCNSGSDTIGGSWRTGNGHRKPYNVKYWCLGNEMWGAWQLGFMQLHHYVLKNNLVADAMWAVDPDLQLIAVGAVDQINKKHDPEATKANRLWSVGMLEDSSDHMNFLSEHFYVGRTPWSKTGELSPVDHVKLAKVQIKRIADEHRRLQPSIEQLDGRIIPIAMDEWNYWHRDYQYGELGCIYDLKDALGIVVGLHEYFRNSDIIQIANYAQTVNVIGCIKTSKTKAEFATTGIALKLYREHWERIPLILPDAGGAYDIAAAISPDGKVLTVSIVNPTDEVAQVDLSVKGAKLPGKATSWVISGKNHRSHNIPGEPREVDAHKTGDVDISSGLKVPSMSSVLYRIEL